MNVALCAIFFLSGAAALAFETLWFRLAALILGNTLWAATLVLSAFMAGLALGNALALRRFLWIRYPVLLYAFLEILVAASGAALIWFLPQLPSLTAPLLDYLSDYPPMAHGLRLMLALILFVLPATAMGLTLPLLTQALATTQGFGITLGRLYGWNTLGALCGALLTELWLIGWLGLRDAGLAIAALSFTAATAALIGQMLFRPAAPLAIRAARPAARLLWAAALAGGLLLALEVVWFRFALLYVRGTGLTFALMLAIVLAGIGAGGLIAAFLLRRRYDIAQQIPAIALGAGLMTALSYLLLSPVWLGATTTEWLRLLALGSALMLPVASLSGLLFTLLGERLHTQVENAQVATGWLTLANTSGAAIGAAFGGWVLLPQLGMEKSLCLLAAGYLGVALLAGPWHWRLALPAGALFFALFLPRSGIMQWHFDAATEAFRKLDGSETVLVREGLTETLQVLEREQWGQPAAHRLVSNNFSMSGSERDSQRYMSLFAWWPLAVHPRVESALLISYGIGSTAQALLDAEEITRLDVVDTSPDTLALSARLHAHDGQDPLKDPRVRIHLEDGRHYLLTRAQRYDLITAEPPPPRLAGVVNLYTLEYFRLLRARLKQGGFASYWLPVDQLKPASTRAILAAFCAAFPDCSLWSGSNYNWFLIGSNEFQGPVDESSFTRQWQTPASARKLASLGFEKPEQLGATFIADADHLAAWIQGIAPLTDNYPKRLVDTAPTDAELRGYSEWMDDIKAESRFRQSRWIPHWWPARLREATLPYFSLQPLLNNQLRLSQIESIALAEALMSQVPLYTPALWLLDSDVAEQQRLDALLKTESYRPDFGYALGVRALLARDFNTAAGFFLDAMAIEPRRAVLPAYYSLCRSGQIVLAREVASEYPDLRIFAADLACELPTRGAPGDFDLSEEDDGDEEDEEEDEEDEDTDGDEEEDDSDEEDNDD